MRRFDFPTAPVVVGMILGPLAEAQMRNALSIGEGRWTIFLQRPGSLALLIVIVAVLLLPRFAEAASPQGQRPAVSARRRRRERAGASARSVAGLGSPGAAPVGQPARWRDRRSPPAPRSIRAGR